MVRWLVGWLVLRCSGMAGLPSYSTQIDRLLWRVIVVQRGSQPASQPIAAERDYLYGIYIRLAKIHRHHHYHHTSTCPYMHSECSTTGEFAMSSCAVQSVSHTHCNDDKLSKDGTVKLCVLGETERDHQRRREYEFGGILWADNKYT